THEHHYDPLTADHRPRRRKNPGVYIGVAIAILAHVGLFFYLWKVKFEVHYKEYSDEATKVELVAPPP
ncbi:hypothetical protein, partial [Escherichia coli]